mmetsp:Transcript_19862/g.48244  ORF Transcript_19862/g.48244 Transcript_19862/m.48244 type:complete len:318 (-) Transcript_19862:71-1024(-)
MVPVIVIAALAVAGEAGSLLHKQAPFETVADGGDGVELMGSDSDPASMIQLLLEANENDVTEDAVLQRSRKDVEIESKSTTTTTRRTPTPEATSAAPAQLSQHGPSLLALESVVRHVKRRRQARPVHEKKPTQPADFNGSFMQTSTLDTQDRALELLTEHVAEAMKEVNQMKLRRAHRHMVHDEPAAQPPVEVVMHKKVRPSLIHKAAQKQRRPFFIHDPDDFLQIKSVTRHNVHVVDDDDTPFASFVQLQSLQERDDSRTEDSLGEVSLEQAPLDSAGSTEESFAQAVTNAQDPMGNIVQDLVAQQADEPPVFPGL